MQNLLNWTTHSVSWFSKRHQAEELELRAPFQRNPVWSEKQKAFLIDTILHGYPIPELYMQESTDAEGNDRFVVVDGQQRLRACLEYIRDEFALDQADSPKWADLKFSELTEGDKKQVYNYPFVVRVLPEMPDADLRAMFGRLNRNVVALNDQELRHATYWGEFIKSVEYLADNDTWGELSIFTPNDVRRMLDVEYVSELAVALLHGLQNKKQKLGEWFQVYEKEYPRRREIEHAFTTVLAELHVAMPNFSNTRWKKKSDFYSLFVLLGKNIKFLPLTREGRKALEVKLTEFGRDVDDCLSGKSTKVSEEAKKYADGVKRAASDLGNRRQREDALALVLADLIGSQPEPRIRERRRSTTSTR